MAVPQDDRTYTVAEAADELGVSASTVWRWIDAKLLPAQRIGRRKIRIRREDLALVVSPARPPLITDLRPWRCAQLSVPARLAKKGAKYLNMCIDFGPRPVLS